MKKKNGYKKSVYRTLAMITQIGVSMLTPILVFTFLGAWIDEKFHTTWFPVLVIIGIAGGFQSVYTLTKHINEDEEDQESDKEAK